MPDVSDKVQPNFNLPYDSEKVQTTADLDKTEKIPTYPLYSLSDSLNLATKFITVDAHKYCPH